MRTLPLDLTAWDLTLDSAGNLALTDRDASLAQDVASALRTFLGDCWYDQKLGMPYLTQIFGKEPPASLIRSKIQQQALTVRNVQTVKTISLRLVDRKLTGTVVITSDYDKQPLVVDF